jgi:DNA-directed RNA polymerase specialized sigma24 family protein
MNNDQFTEISKKLDILTRLLALSLVGERKQQDQIMLLNSIGLQPKEIAEMLDTTPNTVRVTLSTMRKNKRKRGTGYGRKKTEKGERRSSS